MKPNGLRSGPHLAIQVWKCQAYEGQTVSGQAQLMRAKRSQARPKCGKSAIWRCKAVWRFPSHDPSTRLQGEADCDHPPKLSGDCPKDQRAPRRGLSRQRIFFKPRVRRSRSRGQFDRSPCGQSEIISTSSLSACWRLWYTRCYHSTVSYGVLSYPIFLSASWWCIFTFLLVVRVLDRKWKRSNVLVVVELPGPTVCSLSCSLLKLVSLSRLRRVVMGLDLP